MQKKSKYVLGDFLRNQCHIELIANYFSRNPQPQQIDSAQEFYDLYPNFDIDFYRQIFNYWQYADIEIWNHYHFITKYQRCVTNNLIKIVFYTQPIPPDASIGGVNAIFRMAKLINNQNHPRIKAFIYSLDHCKHKNPYCNNFVSPFEIDQNTIVIYPETITGNPLNAQNVIRWILLDLGNEMPQNQYKTWNNEDLVYSWEPKINAKGNIKPKQLCISWIDPHLLHIQHDEDYKYENCYMLRKMNNLDNLKEYTTFHHPKNSLPLDKFIYQDIIKFFTKTKYFYSYDPNTFYNLIAPLCGCVTILHPIPGVSREEYLSSRMNNVGHMLCDAGLAYGYDKEEIIRAENTLKFAKDQMKMILSKYDKTHLSFMSDIERYMSNRKELQNTVLNVFNT